MGIYGACSYALDCVEAELVHVTDKHAKRVAYMSVCLAETMGFQGDSLQDLAACAPLHDNALTQYIKEELHNDISVSSDAIGTSQLGIHCSIGEGNIKSLPFFTDVTNCQLLMILKKSGIGLHFTMNACMAQDIRFINQPQNSTLRSVLWPALIYIRH